MMHGESVVIYCQLSYVSQIRSPSPNAWTSLLGAVTLNRMHLFLLRLEVKVAYSVHCPMLEMLMQIRVSYLVTVPLRSTATDRYRKSMDTFRI